MSHYTTYVGVLGGQSIELKSCPADTFLTELSGHVGSDGLIKKLCGKCSDGANISFYCNGNFDLPTNFTRKGPWSKLGVQYNRSGILSLGDTIPDTSSTIDYLECPATMQITGYNNTYNGEDTIQSMRVECRTAPQPAPIIQVEAPQSTSQSTNTTPQSTSQPSPQSIPTNVVQPTNPTYQPTPVAPPQQSLPPSNVILPIETKPTMTPIAQQPTIPTNVVQPNNSNISPNILTETSQPNTNETTEPSQPSNSSPNQPQYTTQYTPSVSNQTSDTSTQLSTKVKFFILFLFLVVIASVVAMFLRSRKKKPLAIPKQQ